MGVGIEFAAVVGYETKRVYVYLAGEGTSFGITYDGGHAGYLIKYNTGWIFWPSNEKVDIYAEDIRIILDILRDNYPDLEVFKMNDHFAPRVDINSKYDHCYLIPKNRERLESLRKLKDKR